MSILTIAELKGDSLKKVSRELVSTGRKLGGPVVALLINGTDAHANELFDAGADTVVKASSADYSPEGMANIVSAVAAEKGAKVVLAPHSAQGMDYVGRVAIELKAGLVADVIEVGGSVSADSLTVKKPVYSGKAFANIKLSGASVLTVRPNSQEAATGYASPKTLETSSAGEGKVASKLSNVEMTGGTKVSLGDASIVVSGGRGIKGPEAWPMLQELADLLGGAVGASRAPVDAGWIDNSYQIGQTGKTISPDCYIACGISGAIQHLAGMSSSKYIVAVNKDPDAPIFKVTTYGVVDDLFKVVPALTEEFKKLLS